MSRFEKKFGKYAIPNLTLALILCYALGYVIQLINADFLWYLTLDPYKILHGQIWRVFTWLIVPPDTFDIFTLIMLYFYYSIGTLMERTLGTYRYNVYLLTGMFLTILGSFVGMAYVYLFPGGMPAVLLPHQVTLGALAFSTYYINLSIFLAFASTYPNLQVLLMFVVPVKVKWMGILDGVLMLYMFFTGNLFSRLAIGAALLNFAIFYLRNRNLSHLRPKQIKRRVEYQQQVHRNPPITRHKCAICGRTEEGYPNLEFRFCSKCNGNYEYCQDHLFTHEHVK